MTRRKKSSGARTKRPRRKQSKFITPDLALVRGQLMRFVANPDNPLSRAERLRGEYAEMDDGDEAAVGQFLEEACYVAAEFRRCPGEFERLQVHAFWKQTGQKPRDSSTSKWVLYFSMQATTTDVRRRANRYAVILDGLKQDQVEIGAVAARIEELGGIKAAYEAMRARTHE